MGENLILTNNCNPWSYSWVLAVVATSKVSTIHAAKLMCSIISLKGILCYPIVLIKSVVLTHQAIHLEIHNG
jgi:hypothetical protein